MHRKQRAGEWSAPIDLAKRPQMWVAGVDEVDLSPVGTAEVVQSSILSPVFKAKTDSAVRLSHYDTVN